MTIRQKRKVLREILLIYQNTPERSATYRRWYWCASAIAWVSIFFAVLCSFYPGISTKAGIVLAFIGGIAGASALTCASAANSWPLVVRYTTLKEEELKKELAEIESVPQNSTNP